MSDLFSSIVNNASFVFVCIVVVAALCMLAKLTEKKLNIRMVSTAHRITIIAIFSAISTVLHVLDFPLIFLAPEFYKLDFSEVSVLIAGFYLGPSAAVACEGLKILLKLVVKGTSTAFVGDFANFFVGCSFVLPAVIWYHLHKNRNGAVVALIIGTLCMTIVGTAFNAVYLLPKFAQLYGIPMSVLIGMGAKIHNNINNVISFVVMCVAPLNLVKGFMVSIVTLLLYKHVSGAIKLGT